MTDKFLFYVPEESRGMRLDRFLVLQLATLPIPPSRTTVQKMIEADLVTINGIKAKKLGEVVVVGSCIEVAPQKESIRAISLEEHTDFFSQTRVFEHEHFLIINKPAGILTHPVNQNNPQVALSDIFIHDYPSAASVGERERPGIVHRLDKYTSGLIVLAKTTYGYEAFKTLFANRAIQKTYTTLVEGNPPAKGCIVNAIMRDPIDPCRMTCCAASSGKPARTNFEVVTAFQDCTLVKAFPLTGRTHQIRVHFSFFGYPVMGDTLYGAKKPCALKRYVLHASELLFEFDGVPYQFTADLPQDFKAFLETLMPLKGDI